MIGASASIGISDIPWDGPIAGVRVGRVDGKYVINPTEEQMAASTMNVTVAGSEEAIMMVEGGAKEAPEEEVLDAIMFGHETIKEICRFQKKIIEEVGKEKRVLTFPEVPENIEKDVEAFATESLKKASSMRISCAVMVISLLRRKQRWNISLRSIRIIFGCG